MCGSDGVTYFSSCHAGCLTANLEEEVSIRALTAKKVKVIAIDYYWTISACVCPDIRQLLVCGRWLWQHEWSRDEWRVPRPRMLHTHSLPHPLPSAHVLPLHRPRQSLAGRAQVGVCCHGNAWDFTLAPALQCDDVSSMCARVCV